MGSRAVLLVCRSPEDAAGAVRRCRRRSARVWTRTGRPFFPAGLTATWSTRSAPRPRRPACSTSSARPGCCWTPRCCPGTSRPGRCCGTSTPRSARPRWPRSRPRPRRWRRPRSRGPARGSATCWTGPGPGWPTPRRSPPPTRATAGPPTGWPGSASPRSSCSPPKGAVYHERPHLWHLALADRLAAAAPGAVHGHPPRRGGHRRPRLGRRRDPLVGGPDRGRGRGHGGQARREPDAAAQQGLAQPGLKVRGREYLRIIYGPDYTEPANLTRLRQRGLVPQALAGAARVRPRPGSPGPGGPRRAAVARARMRLRRPRPGIRTRRPPPVTKSVLGYAA